MVVMAAQHCECTECLSTVHLKMVKMVNFILYVFYNDWKKRIPGTEKWVWCRVYTKERGVEKVYSCIFNLLLLSFSPKFMALEITGSEKKFSMKLLMLTSERSMGQASIYLTHTPPLSSLLLWITAGSVTCSWMPRGTDRKETVQDRPRWRSKRMWSSPPSTNASKIHLQVEQFSRKTTWKLAEELFPTKAVRKIRT